MIKTPNNSNPKCVTLRDKKIYLVDDHQYILPVWGKLFQATKKSYTLVSIDYHPDTNQPFWLYAYQKAMVIDPDRELALVEKFQKRVMASIDLSNLETIKKVMDKMQNDEHINTAMALGYIKNYHMINCMEKHQYHTGYHYLVGHENFGSIGDSMFKEIQFSMESLKDEAFILDIDLDYFLYRKNFQYNSGQINVFKNLVLGASIITIARSVTYFNYLKKENFSITECEDKLIALIKKILSKKEL